MQSQEQYSIYSPILVKSSSTVFPIFGKKKFSYLIKEEWKDLERISLSTRDLYDEFLQGKRTIESPREPLKGIQRKIYRRILRDIALPEYFHGSVIGKSPFSNAVVHSGKKSILKVDLKKCFNLITNKQIYSVWRYLLCCSPDVSRMGTILTTYKGHLPQGPSTSPMLANLVLLPTVMQVAEYCKPKNLSITQYLDDQTISGDFIDKTDIENICRIYAKNGLRLNREKIILMTKNRPQEVTGYNVRGKKPLISKEFRIKTKSLVNSIETGKIPNNKKNISKIQGMIEMMKKTHHNIAIKLRERINKIKIKSKT